MRDTHYKLEPQKRESKIFPIPLYLTIYSARFSLKCLDGLVVSVLDSYFWGPSVRATAISTCMLFLFYFLLMDSVYKII